ncbi:MAG: cell wall-binding repeat-containing protein [Actinomycetota bacterium]|jgi:putative cell wall-binding protein|nr:cell wall-binding repeat-containing protein [Actinomycetota bacterium]
MGSRFKTVPRIALSALLALSLVPVGAFAVDLPTAGALAIANARGTHSPRFRVPAHPSVDAQDVTTALASDDDIPGAPLPPTGFSLSLNDETDTDDVYNISLTKGDVLSVGFQNATIDVDFDLYLYGPGATSIGLDPWVDLSAWNGAEDLLTYTAPETGTYYIDAYAYSGSGSAQIAWSVSPLVSDDDVPGATLEAYNSGNLNDLAGDNSDAFAVGLKAGQTLSLSLTYPVGQAVGLFLFQPGLESVLDTEVQLAYSLDLDGSDQIDFVVPPYGDGQFTVLVYTLPGSGDACDYQLSASAGFDQVARLSGMSRYNTASTICASTFTGSSTAVLATGANFPDALSASGLAGALGAPLLLVQPDDVPFDIAGEIVRLGVSEIYIVGGVNAVSANVEALLSGPEPDGFGLTVQRIQGTTRYETAQKVAMEMDTIYGGTPDTAFLVRGDGFADALAVAPYAYMTGYPVLLTPSTSLDGFTRAYLEDSGVSDVVIAGGFAAVSSSVGAQIKGGLSTGPINVTRLAGASRTDTARLVAEWGNDDMLVGDWQYVGISTGWSFPDALSGGAAMGWRFGPLLLTSPTSLSAEAKAALETNRLSIDQVYVFGGENAVSSDVMTQIEQALAP